MSTERIAEIRERVKTEHNFASPMSPTRAKLLRKDLPWLLTRLEEAERVIGLLLGAHSFEKRVAADRAARRFLEGE